VGEQAAIIAFKRTNEFPPCAYWDFDEDAPCARAAGWAYKGPNRAGFMCGRCRKALLEIAPMIRGRFKVLQ
jgi:hypothetical protein